MRSVADDLREETRANARRMTIQARRELAFALGEKGLQRFCAARGVTREEGRRLLQRQRQQGRPYSRCMDELLS